MAVSSFPVVIELPERHEQNVSVFQSDLGFKHAVSNIFFYQMAVESVAVKRLPIVRSLGGTKYFFAQYSTSDASSNNPGCMGCSPRIRHGLFRIIAQ